MTYHSWGDDWEHWSDLYEAERYIAKYVRRWSRCLLISKEKYGTLRYQCIIPPGGHAVCRKFCIFLPWNKTYKSGDQEFKMQPLLWCWNESLIHQKWKQFGNYILRKAVMKACAKYPHLVLEITSDMDWEYCI